MRHLSRTKWPVIVWLLTITTLCTASASTVQSHRVFRADVPDEATFHTLSKQIGNERFSKFILDLRTQEIIYFDVNVYEMHTDFVFQEVWRKPSSPESLFEFNRNYSANKPQFILGYVVHHIHSDQWTLSFFSGDRLSAPHVLYAWNRVQQTFFAAPQMAFLPDSTHQLRLAGAGLEGLPVVTRDELYRALPVQVFHAAKRVGVLRILGPEVTQHSETLSLPAHSIVILQTDLPDLPIVSGIVSENFSTPLSHVALRARSWGIPHVGVLNAASTHGSLEGKTVVLEVTAAAYTLREATRDEIHAWKETQARPRPLQVPEADLKPRELRDLHALRAAHVSAYGAKAAQLGEVAQARLSGFRVPSGFAIPISWYVQHLQRHGLHHKLATLHADPRFHEDRSFRAEALSAFRAQIRQAALDPRLESALASKLRSTGISDDQGVFVRSSTNAEDLPGFNGAGLYDTVPNVRGLQDISAAVRQVWASLWNGRAWEERTHFGIDQNQVFAAVLIQVGVNATAAGVLLTTDLFNPTHQNVYTINAKNGLGLRVVEGRRIPEQLLFDLNTLTIKVISRSDESTMLVFAPDGGVREVPVEGSHTAVLTDARAHLLAVACSRLPALFPEWNTPLDVEWLFEGDALYLVQVRPYIEAGE